MSFEHDQAVKRYLEGHNKDWTLLHDLGGVHLIDDMRWVITQRGFTSRSDKSRIFELSTIPLLSRCSSKLLM